MGRSIHYKKIGGKPTGANDKIAFTAWFEGETAAVEVYLVKQTGSRRYRLSKLDDSASAEFVLGKADTLKAGECLVTALPVADLTDPTATKLDVAKLTLNRATTGDKTPAEKYYIGTPAPDAKDEDVVLDAK